MTTANILSQLGSPGVSTGFKNRIINGAMTIDQRNAGASVTLAASNPVYTLDRWYFQTSQASKLSIQQGSLTNNFGFTNAMLATSLSAYSVGSGDYYTFSQRIEGYNVSDLNWGTASAKSITLSFWVYSSLTGTFGGAIGNGNFNRSYPFSYTISSANTWTQVSVTIPGDTTGTWATTSGIGLVVYFSLGSGSTYAGAAGSWQAAGLLTCTGATSVVGTNGATWYITGVQLEVGTTATNFDYRSYTTELQLCQRYFYMLAKGSGQPVSQGAYYSAGLIQNAVTFPTTMRITPSIYEVTGTGYYVAYSNGGATTFNGIGTIPRGTPNLVQIDSTSGVSGTQAAGVAVATNNANTVLGFSAEL